MAVEQDPEEQAMADAERLDQRVERACAKLDAAQQGYDRSMQALQASLNDVEAKLAHHEAAARSASAHVAMLEKDNERLRYLLQTLLARVEQNFDDLEKEAGPDRTEPQLGSDLEPNPASQPDAFADEGAAGPKPAPDHADVPPDFRGLLERVRQRTARPEVMDDLQDLIEEIRDIKDRNEQSSRVA